MQPSELAERLHVLRIARTWIGTPFHDQQKVKVAGVDCAQLIAAIFEEAGLIDVVDIGYYSPQWFLHRDEERYLSYVLPRAKEIAESVSKPADLVVFKIGRCFAHGAILTEEGWPNVIHAYKPEGTVTFGRGDAGDLSRRQRRFFRYAGWQ
jgi:hypothetical protein